MYAQPSVASDRSSRDGDFESLGEQREVSLPQGTIRYRERGTGEPIVFVHGALVNARPVAQGRAGRWRRTSAASRPTCRSARTSVPMTADADLSPPGVAKLIADFLAALDLENVTLVGNDTGGALCQMVVTQPPRARRAAGPDQLRRVRGVPARACSSSCSGPASIPGFVSALAQPMRFDRAAHTRRSPSAGCQATASRARDLRRLGRPARRTRGVRRDTGQVPQGVDKRYMLEAAAQAAGEFEKPVLLAWGRTTDSSRLSWRERLARDFPNARLEGSRTRARSCRRTSRSGSRS